jgi:broad specificity phosphatase PhoE
MITDSNREWSTESWLSSARNLVKWASSTQPQARILLLVRHSHRDVIDDHTGMLNTELTPLGLRMSREFGRRLPANRMTRMFCSFVSRCYQTADEISRGIKENGGEIDEFDALAVLATPEVRDETVWQELQPDGRNVTDYVNRWGDGKFGNRIEPFNEYEPRLMDHLVRRLSAEGPGAMHIHVTHDLALMAAKRMLLGRPVASSDREPYLGGIGIVIDDEGTRLYIGCNASIQKMAV